MKEIVENALGHVVVEVHGDTDETLYGYFDEYGTVPNGTDELSLVTDEPPMYPTKNVVEVKVERLNAAYQVTEARWLDTSGDVARGEWHSLDELEE